MAVAVAVAVFALVRELGTWRTNRTRWSARAARATNNNDTHNTGRRTLR